MDLIPFDVQQKPKEIDRLLMTVLALYLLALCYFSHDTLMSVLSNLTPILASTVTPPSSPTNTTSLTSPMKPTFTPTFTPAYAPTIALVTTHDAAFIYTDNAEFVVDNNCML
ncbi:uncharacterized protein EV154DRAFT_486026 [Mucor mucedo]|uniref:uncharacterized protein n=1 Tax=Mucor mucedo TaxID=29922 RepID=UPI00221FB965|nr:uncharacterized protein EV154DRAFT_486026 [Mucor mucedo]KAI7879528.1 hypothetical protein EV154DRAFT_486026 [Mucor mucedo]